MSRLMPDPTFYPSPKMAMEAPQEKYGYVVGLNYGRNEKPDALLVVDLDEEFQHIWPDPQPG
jgi:methanethiol oxidase